jgi:hypothetical protein
MTSIMLSYPPNYKYPDRYKDEFHQQYLKNIAKEEQTKQKRREYYQKNKDKIKQQRKEYYKKFREQQQEFEDNQRKQLRALMNFHNM